MPLNAPCSHSVGLAAVAYFSASCHAAVVLTFSDAYVGTNAFQLLGSPGTAMSGTVTGITMNAVMTESQQYTQARYAVLYFGAPIAGFLATVGSVNNPYPYPTWVNPQWSPWADGASSAPGTPLTAQIDFAQPFSASSISSLGFALPNAVNSGYWMRLTGSLTLHGVDLVPAPGALALLGLAGLAQSRRR